MQTNSHKGNIMRVTEKATVVYLKGPDGRFCFAPKNGNIHKEKGEELKGSAEKLNGYGGKQEVGETILQTAIRELYDESGVIGKEENLELIAKINFFWPGNDTLQPDMVVYFFFLSVYEGEPQETIEMGPPQWLLPSEVDIAIEGNLLNKADKFFLPKLFAGEKKVLDIFHGKKNEDGTPLIIDKETTPTL